jgi:hypothetical protein
MFAKLSAEKGSADDDHVTKKKGQSLNSDVYKI